MILLVYEMGVSADVVNVAPPVVDVDYPFAFVYLCYYVRCRKTRFAMHRLPTIG